MNGAAVGIGMTMILPFDVIVASEKAKFGMLFIKVGLVPELASTHFLVQRMGFGRASEMCLSGRLYGGAEAHAMRGSPIASPRPTTCCRQAIALADEIAANPDPQLRMTKELLTRNGCATDLGRVQRARDARCCASAGRRPSTRRRCGRSSRSARRSSRSGDQSQYAFSRSAT